MTAVLENAADLAADDDTVEFAQVPHSLSPGRRVERISTIFEKAMNEIMEFVPSASMRKLISKQINLAEAAACRAVLQQRR